MELLEAIKGRRSVRVFKRQPIPNSAVETMIDAARRAPSAGNIQPWEFVIVKDRQIRRRLAEAALNQTLLEEAPLVIIVCADEKRSSLGYGIRGRTLYCLQDTAAATQNILLVAHSMGLGACWIGSFNEDEVKSILKAPDGIRPVALIPLGHPNESPRERRRRLLSQIVHYDGF